MDSVDQVLEGSGRRGFEAQPRTTAGVSHPKREGVETKARSGNAVACITDDRVPEPGEMRADLVPSPGFELDLQQAAAPTPIVNSIMRAGILGFSVPADPDVQATILPERLVDETGRGIRLTLDDGEIGFLGLAPFRLQIVADVPFASEEKHARGLTIEAMNRPEVRLPLG